MTFPPRGSRELRKGRFSQPGGLYFVTASTDQREKVFIHPEINRILREAIHWLEDKNKWDWRIYMIMPDHVHLLFQLGEGETLASVMKSWKGYTAGKILKWLSGQECPSHQAKAKDGQECPSHQAKAKDGQSGDYRARRALPQRLNNWKGNSFLFFMWEGSPSPMILISGFQLF